MPERLLFVRASVSCSTIQDSAQTSSIAEERGISSPPSGSEHSKVTQSDIDSVSVELLHEMLPLAWVSRLHGTEEFQLTHPPRHAGLDSFPFQERGWVHDRHHRSPQRIEFLSQSGALGCSEG